MLRRIRWLAVGALSFIVLALVATVVEEHYLGIVLGLCAITFALLSLNES